MVTKGIERKERWGLRNRVKSRHVDFVICDKQNIKPLLAIELDDSTHRRKDRKESDEFKDEIFEDMELPLLRIMFEDLRNLEKLKAEIKIKIEGERPEEKPKRQPGKKFFAFLLKIKEKIKQLKKITLPRPPIPRLRRIKRR